MTLQSEDARGVKFENGEGKQYLTLLGKGLHRVKWENREGKQYLTLFEKKPIRVERNSFSDGLLFDSI